MIPESTALARLARERNYWKRTVLKTQYARGIIDGLLLASKIVSEIWIETRAQFKRNPNYLAACISRCSINVKRGGPNEKRKRIYAN